MSLKFVFTAIACLLAIDYCCISCHGNIIYEDVVISPEESLLLNKFREMAKPVLANLTQDWMNDDIYLVKFLRISNLDITEATQMFQDMLNWRIEYGMDGILDEDFSDFELEFPYDNEAVDNDGRPVGTAHISDWDVRKVMISGRQNKAIRYAFRVAEIGARKAMEAYKDGYNVSKAMIIANLKHFTKLQHACPLCIPVYRNLIVALQNYYPHMIHKFIGINTPISFYPVLRVFLAALRPSRRGVIKLYGMDKRQWQKAILSMVPPEQLSSEFGGSKLYENET